MLNTPTTSPCRSVCRLHRRAHHGLGAVLRRLGHRHRSRPSSCSWCRCAGSAAAFPWAACGDGTALLRAPCTARPRTDPGPGPHSYRAEGPTERSSTPCPSGSRSCKPSTASATRSCWHALPAGTARSWPAGPGRGRGAELDHGVARLAGLGRARTRSRPLTPTAPAGRGAHHGGRPPGRAARARLRHLVSGRRRRRPSLRGRGAALHGGADLRLDGAVMRTARAGRVGRTPPTGRCPSGAALPGGGHARHRGRSPTPMRRFTPSTTLRRRAPGRCSCTTATAAGTLLRPDRAGQPGERRLATPFRRRLRRRRRRIGFDGFHVDTYGYPRLAYDAKGARST